MSQTFEEIEIKNQGPITYLKLLVPRRGGVVVLTGPNGSGKSNALAGIDQLVTRQGKLVSRDGSQGAEIKGFQARVALGRRISRSGELEIHGLEGFSIADLVDPGIDDLEARDGKRIKALLRLADAPANAELFYPVLGSQEEFDLYVPSEVLATDDIVAMQGSIKRALEKAAREADQRRGIVFSKSESHRLSAEGIDVTLPDDSELLSTAFEDATRDEARLKAERKSAKEAIDKAENAKISLQAIKDSYKGLSFKEANDKEGEAFTQFVNAQQKVNELTKLLKEANDILTTAEHDHKLAQQVEQSAKEYEESIKSFEDIISGEIPEAISDDQLTRAAERLKNTREAVEQGVLVRKAKEDLAKAAELKKEATEAREKSETLRLAAQSTEMVLSHAVSSLGVPLAVVNNRLVVNDTERPGEVFDDLSDGEKWKLAADIAVKTVGPGGVIILPQTAWQDLDQANKRILAEGVEAKTSDGVGVIVITAQADSSVSEITPKIYDPFALAE